MNELTQERVRDLFDYNPETGVVTRRIRTSNCTNVGDIVGTPSKGYVQVGKDARLFREVAEEFYGFHPNHGAVR